MKEFQKKQLMHLQATPEISCNNSINSLTALFLTFLFDETLLHEERSIHLPSGIDSQSLSERNNFCFFNFTVLRQHKDDKDIVTAVNFHCQCCLSQYRRLLLFITFFRRTSSNDICSSKPQIALLSLPRHYAKFHRVITAAQIQLSVFRLRIICFILFIAYYKHNKNSSLQNLTYAGRIL